MYAALKRLRLAERRQWSFLRNAGERSQTKDGRIPAPMANIVLVVDDDAAVRRFVVSVLKAEGFQVVEAENGAAALFALARAEAPIRVVVSDICMAGLDGVALCEKATEMSGDIRFVFMTGFADNERLVSVSTRFPVITKPFLPQVLVSCVRLALSTGSGRHESAE